MRLELEALVHMPIKKGNQHRALLLKKKKEKVKKSLTDLKQGEEQTPYWVL